MMETKGTKQEKVRAAFEYADFFLEQCYHEEVIDDIIDDVLNDETPIDKEKVNESENRTSLSRLFSRSK